MRLWSIHPKYLDVKGLLALWREGLLAKKVLEGKTKGYKKHPQLIRFRKYKSPIDAIDAYLYQVLLESKKRGYKFNEEKIRFVILNKKILVTEGQILYEFNHLLKKLLIRDRGKYEKIKGIKKIEVNSIFRLIEGNIEQWEKI